MQDIQVSLFYHQSPKNYRSNVVKKKDITLENLH